jgi:predicted metal-dependent hydrolase|tara:strand:+ start:10293 stop:10994 length:702 start_codon:yes stop_codon:yes gene_type:complete
VIPEFDLPLVILRTNRKKTVSIEVTPSNVKVSAPKRLSNRVITDFITERSRWIEKNVRLQLEQPKQKTRTWSDGEMFAYLGQDYPLRIKKEIRSVVDIDDGHLDVEIPRETLKFEEKQTVKSLIAAWYKQKASEKLITRSVDWSKLLKVEPASIRIKEYKSQWGSCSVSGVISYDWRIIMAPIEVVDYLVVHELAHLLEHNHSQKYWRHVETIIPDFREQQAWLKLNARTLNI